MAKRKRPVDGDEEEDEKKDPPKRQQQHNTNLDECCICLNPCSCPHRPVNCQHVFCRSCIEKWLEIAESCPSCKTKAAETVPVVVANQNFLDNANREAKIGISLQDKSFAVAIIPLKD